MCGNTHSNIAIYNVYYTWRYLQAHLTRNKIALIYVFLGRGKSYTKNVSVKLPFNWHIRMNEWNSNNRPDGFRIALKREKRRFN